MKRLITSTLLAVWSLALVVPATATAVAVPVVPEEECVVGNTTGCDPTHTITKTEVNEDGDIVTTTTECQYDGVDVEDRPDGGADVSCNYGNCGNVPLGPA